MVKKKTKKGARRKGRKKGSAEDSVPLDHFLIFEKKTEEKDPSPSLDEKKDDTVIVAESGTDGKKRPEKKLKYSSNVSLLERSEKRRSGGDIVTNGSEPPHAKIRSKPVVMSGINANDIESKDARKFLGNMRACINNKRNVALLFHNDMDGLNGALLIKDMISRIALDDIQVKASPMEYSDIQEVELNEDICYIFIDMDISLSGDNIFRIDHHGEDRDKRTVTDHMFILTPPEKDYEYPSTAAALCGYLHFISQGGRVSFLRYLSKGSWQNDPFQRLLILLASVCDNLWHLNFLIDIPMKAWIPDPEEERYLVLISISASLLLGDDDRRDELIESFFGDSLTSEVYLGKLCGSLTGAQNVLSLAESVSKEAEGFYNRIFFNITDSIERTISTWEKDNKVLKELEMSMPIDMRGNRDKMMELLKTKGDTSMDHWKRIEFYGKEMERLENKIKVEERKLLKLRAAKKMFSTESGPRLCVVIPRQGSKQIKGIIASLLYYKGWKNVVIEERGSEAAWGARGFSKKTIEGYFSNLSMGYDELKDYLFMEKVFKDLPDAFRRTVNISKNISFYKTYEGGMGGRGQIFGGSLRGRVPWIFSLLEESGEMEEKVKELMKHKELGDALRGLTEGQSTVSTAQALRAKFKSTGWLVVSLIPGTDGADVLLGNFTMGLMHLVGYNERFQFFLKEQEKKIRMDHGRFDVAD